MNTHKVERSIPFHRSTDHERVLALARRFGWSSTSFQLLEPGYRYFFPDGEACVAYVDTGGAWVAAGPPLADDPRMAEIVCAFVEAARAAGRRACFFGTEERFAALVPLRHLLVGEQAIWDPGDWGRTVQGSRTLREQLRRARAKGVRVRSVSGPPEKRNGAPTERAIASLVDRWHRTRELAPMGFLARAEPLPALSGQVLFVAEQEDQLVGLLSVSPIFARGGWLFQNLLRAPDAPNGTAEALVDHAMWAAVGSGRHVVTLGLAPLSGEVAAPLRLARALGAPLYNFEGLRAFKAKLRPTRWDRIFVSFPTGTGPLRVLVDVLAAFAHGNLLRFGLRTFIRGPTFLVGLLAILLVPWTALLATGDSGAWFPHPAVRWAWVGFDAIVATGLFLLRARWRVRLARAITFAIGADALLTVIEGVSWNWPRATGIADGIVLAIGASAPTLAFFVLWRATIRRSAPSTREPRPAARTRPPSPVPAEAR